MAYELHMENTVDQFLSCKSNFPDERIFQGKSCG